MPGGRQGSTRGYLEETGYADSAETHQPVRSGVALPPDNLYCWNMACNAVHAAMARNTELLIGRWHGRFVDVPMLLATPFRKQVDTTGDLWSAVIESTGQPAFFRATTRRECCHGQREGT